jgi:long-subunit acyl-CoA synthetase (AMP-forming)
MIGYKNNPEATAQFFTVDKTGKKWGKCNVMGYMDQDNNIHIKGRMGLENEVSINGRCIPLFAIADAILKDTKKILSCEVIKNGEIVVANIEFQPNVSINQIEVLRGATSRCEKCFGETLINSLFFKIRNSETSYPLTCCGKRSCKALREEELTGELIRAYSSNPEVSSKMQRLLLHSK